MEKILSTRVDESIIRRIGLLAQRLHTSKRAIIEAAILSYAEKTEREKNVDVLEQTLGGWKRRESPDATVKQARRAFRESMERHQR